MIHHLQHIVDIVEICRLKAIDQLVISPGSRNAPLIKQFASDPSFRLHSIVDERSAAFYALGIAMATQKPVILICTSGTAVLNYAPALAEAFYQNIPLIAITADRPEELIDQQDNQTIRQANIYSNFIKESIHLHHPITSISELDAQHLAINNAINHASEGIKGPIHINVPISEPLYVGLPQVSTNIKISETPRLLQSHSKFVYERWRDANKRLIICGEMNTDFVLNKRINQLSNNDKTVVLAEAISNIKGENIISEVDRVMMRIEQLNNTNVVPDFIISMGGPVVSKRLKLWLQKHKETIHYRISEEDDHINTYHNLTGVLTGNPSEITKQLLLIEPLAQNEYVESWQQAESISNKYHHKFLKSAPYSDLKVFDIILNNLPNRCILHLGNSSPVRYSQLFDTSKGSGVFSNRGVSGIDGCLSTAAGYASQSDVINLLIMGDLSFLYDSNGLWNRNLSPNLRIIVINNQGGGIFRMIPGPSQINGFEEFIETNHPVNIEKFVSAFGITYYGCEQEKELFNTFNQFMESKSGPALFEIKTPKLINAEVFNNYIKSIKEG